MADLTGILVPLVTPFSSNDSLDLGVLEQMIERLINAGVDGIIVAGSTGEGLALSTTERAKLIASAVDTTSNRVEVIVGCSAYSTADVIMNIKVAHSLGAHGAMITHPYYALPDERELLNHYSEVTSNIDLPLIVYNNPATTGIDAKPELISEIATLKNVAAIKESSGDCTRVSRIRSLTNNRLPVLCGTDNQALEQLSAGAQGWVAGVANVIPDQCVRLAQLINKGDLHEAQSLYERIFAYLHLAESTGKYVQVNRYGLQKVGIPVGKPRLPLLEVSDTLAKQIDSALARANK